MAMVWRRRRAILLETPGEKMEYLQPPDSQLHFGPEHQESEGRQAPANSFFRLVWHNATFRFLARDFADDA